MRLKPGSEDPVRVVVAGGGVAGFEALTALRALAADRVELELITPERTFTSRSAMVAATFGGSSGRTIEIANLARTIRVDCTTDSILQVDTRRNVLSLASGESRSYDALVIATGARAEEAVPGALTFGGPGGTERFRKMLAIAEEGNISDLVFAVPALFGWPLALYELAMLTAERLRACSVSAKITLLTPEPAPLAEFGWRASGAVLEELEDRGICFIAGRVPTEIAWGQLRATPGRVRINADVVVTLPRLRGPALDGLPADANGFIPADRHGLVPGTTNVYAAGDVMSFPIKHCRLSTQQGDAAAESIAARIGVDCTPAPFRPVLDGMLLTRSEPRYLKAPATEG